jgi:uncharacterized protein (DUF488 family)
MNVYTVGYEGVALEQFIERLRLADVQLVVDVRDVPLSRKRGFSKTALSAALSEAGLQYLHIRELGCPKLIRDQYRLDGDWKRYTAAFMTHLRQQAAAVRDLAAACRGSAVALLCYEADSGRCHRTYVARAVAGVVAGARVVHIAADGVIPDRAIAAAA